MGLICITFFFFGFLFLFTRPFSYYDQTKGLLIPPGKSENNPTLIVLSFRGKEGRERGKREEPLYTTMALLVGLLTLLVLLALVIPGEEYPPLVPTLPLLVPGEVSPLPPLLVPGEVSPFPPLLVPGEVPLLVG